MVWCVPATSIATVASPVPQDGPPPPDNEILRQNSDGPVLTRGSEIPRSADVVIVGAGIIGASIAFHLAARGATDVVVLERDGIASGATAKATGGIRQQFSSEADIRLSRESVRFFEAFEDRVGLPFHFRQNGYLFLIANDEQLRIFTRNAELQNHLDVPTEIITPDEIRRRHPMIEIDGLVGASFCPTDGSGSPADATYAFARRARDSGATILEGVTVTGIVTNRGRVEAVKTTSGTITTGTVVNAAGPWAALIGEMAGLALPVSPRPRQVFSVSPVEGLGPDFPFTIDMGSGVYVHQEPGSILLGGGDRETESSFEPVVDWSRFEGLVDAVTRRVPALADARSVSAWSGLREMTPDDHAILGPVPDLAGYWNAVGFSGHGFMHAPAIGRIMAEWLLDGDPTGIDTAHFALDRFSSMDVAAERLVF
jgi:sarcosine oxidase, subunit beta